MMKKQPELTALTRKTLIDAYFDLTAKGKKATVAAITQQAGYNRCTFYRYFTDTVQLLEQIETEICGAFREALLRYDPVFAPSEIIQSFVMVYEQYGDYLSVLLGKHGDARFAGRMKEIMYPAAVRLFTSASASDSGVITELKSEFVLSAVLAMITKWYDMKQPLPVTELGMLLKNVLQGGVF